MGAHKARTVGITPFSRMLQDWRHAKDLVQHKVADAIRMERITLSALERGIQTPSGPEKLAIANFYKKPMVLDPMAYVPDREYVPSWTKQSSNGHASNNGPGLDWESRLAQVETKLRELGIEL